MLSGREDYVRYECGTRVEFTFCMTSKIKYPLSLTEPSAAETWSNHWKDLTTISSVISGIVRGDQ